jgi:poly-gamma-glutamate synthesis protein (capsule biosynthesis protein)
VYRGRLILYGCGDLINDYEGIEGHEQYRDDLVLMYFATLAMPAGVLTALDMAPMQIRRLRLNNAARSDTHWLRDTLDAVSAPFGSRVDVAPDGGLTLRWR